MHSCCESGISSALVKPSIGGCLLTQVFVLNYNKDNKLFESSCMQGTDQDACMMYCKLLMSICAVTQNQLKFTMYGQSAHAVCMCAAAAHKTDSSNQFHPGSAPHKLRRPGRLQVRHKISNVRDASVQACLKGHVYFYLSVHVWHACLTTMTAWYVYRCHTHLWLVKHSTTKHMLQSKAIQEMHVHVISCSVVVNIMHQLCSS